MFSRIELTGKRGRTVAILVTHDILQAMNVLVSERGRCGIKQDNGYMFAVNHSDNFIVVVTVYAVRPQNVMLYVQRVFGPLHSENTLQR